MTEIVVERPKPPVGVVRINRPDVRNALNMSAKRKLAEVFRGFVDDESLRCVVLTGEGEGFAAGADIEEMVDVGTVEMYLRHNERLWESVTNCPVPVIAAVSGYALGGGLELALLADIIVAGRRAKLGQPEVKVGIMPGAGGTQRLMRAVGKYHAMRLCLTGEIIEAEEAFAMGMVSKVVDDDQVMSEAWKLAETIANLPPVAIAQIKEVIVQGQDASLPAGLALERKAMQLLFGSDDQVEGMRAFLEKRRPSFKGA